MENGAGVRTNRVKLTWFTAFYFNSVCMYNLYYKNSLKTYLDKRVQLLLSFNFTVIFKKIFLFTLTFYLLYLQYVHQNIFNIYCYKLSLKITYIFKVTAISKKKKVINIPITILKTFSLNSSHLYSRVD